MKKMLVIALGFVTLFLHLHSVYGMETFTKHYNNPLTVSLPAGYDTIFQSHIFYSGGLFRAVFSAKNAADVYDILYAESTDAKHWENAREVLSLGEDVGTPRMFIDETGVRLFFSALADGKYHIYSVLCSADFICENSKRLELAPQSGSWDAQDVASPFIIREGELYWLLYSGWKNDGWKIGAAYSSDGHSWARCNNNPIITYGDGPFVTDNSGVITMYYHKPDASGIFQTHTTGALRCDSQWSEPEHGIQKDQPYDNSHIIAPSVIQKDGHTYIFYSGKDTNNIWHLAQASNFIFDDALIVVIPGFGASWNKDALLHGKSVSSADWKIAPFVHEYDGLINTFSALHLQEDSDYVLFPYDWRKHVEESADELYTYLSSSVWIKSPGRKVVLIGHSLGGLVARVFAQKHPQHTSRIITVATPHNGLPLVYKPLSSGEIDREDTLLWLGQRILLALEKKLPETDKETLTRVFPVLFDLLPTYDFLTDSSSKNISISSMSLHSSLLTPSQFVSEHLFTIYGYGTPSPALIQTKPASSIQNLLHNYADGEPINILNQDGDGMVPLVSSQIKSFSFSRLQLDHGELVSSTSGVEEILKDIPYLYAQKAVKEGSKTIITPSLLFLVQSPVTISVQQGDTTYLENDGVVHIPNAQSGTYTIVAQGHNTGPYTIHVAQIAKENSLWETIKSSMTHTPPENHTYSVVFNAQHAKSIVRPTPTPSISPTVTTAPTNAAEGSLATDTHPSNTTPTESSQTMLVKSDVRKKPEQKSAGSVLGYKNSHTIVKPNGVSSAILYFLGGIFILIVGLFFAWKKHLFKYVLSAYKKLSATINV